MRLAICLGLSQKISELFTIVPQKPDFLQAIYISRTTAVLINALFQMSQLSNPIDDWQVTLSVCRSVCLSSHTVCQILCRPFSVLPSFISSFILYAFTSYSISLSRLHYFLFSSYNHLASLIHFFFVEYILSALLLSHSLFLFSCFTLFSSLSQLHFPLAHPISHSIFISHTLFLTLYFPTSYLSLYYTLVIVLFYPLSQ